jgi:pyridoxal phosphate enzyme (YggS family)
VELAAAGIVAGIQDLGENYVQEMVEKHQLLGEAARWHFIGHLQRNKAHLVAPFVYMVHGVDSERLARQLDKDAASANRTISVLLQVNISEEGTKSGVAPSDVPALAEVVSSFDHLRLQGLMTIPAPAVNPEDSRASFSVLARLRDSLSDRLHVDLPHLSMGMTDDFEVAIEEGATIVRIGTALFGARA